MWRSRYLWLLAALVVVQTLGRLAYHRLTFGNSLWGLGTHLLLVAAFLGIALLLVSRLPDRWRGVPVAATAVVVLLGTAHALCTYFDLFQMIWQHFARMRGPVWLPFSDPNLALALLHSVEIGLPLVAPMVALLVGLHWLLYAPVAGRIVGLARKASAARIPLGAGRAIRGDIAILAAIGLVVVAKLALPGYMWRAEPFRNAAWSPFQMAPPRMMTGAGAVPKQFPPQPPLTRPRPVILILADALRRDRTGAYNPAMDTTPFLDRLRDEGKLHVVPSPYATCTFSFCGIMSVLASQSWDDFSASPPTVIDMFARHDYRTYLLLSGRQRGFGRLPQLYADRVTVMRDQEDLGADDRHIVTWLRELDIPDPRRSFLYLHLMSTHGAVKLEPGFAPAGGAKAPYPVRYLAMVRQMDSVIEQIFAALREKGLLEDALVVITSDHGEMLGEDGLWFHGGRPHEAAIGVPIMIYDGAGTRWPDRALASTIDIAPTMLRAAGGQPHPAWRGQALQDEAPVDAVPLGTAEMAGAIVRLDGRSYKYLCRRDTGVEYVRLLDGSANGIAVQKPGALLPRLRAAQRRVATPPAGPCGWKAR
jgi:hypothetical protein